MDKYHILQQIGEGAFGTVYKARKKQTSQILALKRVSKRGKSEKDLNNFRQEIQILKALKHENIILLLDAFETPHEFCLVTEFAQGELFEIIEHEETLSEAEIRRIAQQLVQALHYLHSNRVIHRDMKPQNILISSNGTVKLCDFGFARAMSNDTLAVTSLKGTPLYMAPEVVQELPYNETVDLWSLGVILYELFHGKPPFYSNNLYALIQQVVNDPVKFPDNMSPEFKGFLKGLLNKVPSERLNWPDLLNHPFVRETEQEKAERKKRQDNYFNGVEGKPKKPVSNLQPQMFEYIDKNGKTDRDISPKSMPCPDEQWQKYENLAQDEKGASALKADVNFLHKLLLLLQNPLADVVKSRDKKLTLQCGLKVLSLIMLKAKPGDETKLDVVKNNKIPLSLIANLKQLVGSPNLQYNIDLASDLVRSLGLLAKTNFDKEVGIDNVYVKSFIPLVSSLLKVNAQSLEGTYQSLIANIIKTIGILASQASIDPLLSVAFYKEVLEHKLLSKMMSILKKTDIIQPSHTYLVKVLALFMHPTYGDIFTFPWLKSTSSAMLEFNEALPLFDGLKQEVSATLEELEWAEILIKIFNSDDETSNSNQIKLSVLRIVYQSLKTSKDFGEKVTKNKQFFNFVERNIYTEDHIICATTIQIITQILKQGRREWTVDFNMNTTYLLELFKKNILADPIVSVLILNLLAELISVDAPSTSLILQKVDNLEFYKLIYEIIASTAREGITRIEEVRKIEGSCYGCPVLGFFDGIFNFLHKLSIRFQKESYRIREFWSNMQQSGLTDSLFSLLVQINHRSDISPRGFISMLSLIHDCIYNDFNSFAFKVFQSTVLQILSDLIKENQIIAIQEWPASYGGGQTYANVIMSQILSIINMPYVFLMTDKDLDNVSKEFKETDIIATIAAIFKFLPKEQIGIGLSILSKLVLNSDANKPFAHQFYENNGLFLIKKYDLLAFDGPTTVISDALNIITQLARLSKEYYEPIHQLNLYIEIKNLMYHNDPNIRAKICNLIGNICRYSGYFYDVLLKHALISDIVQCCQDSDKNVRKFACFAVGNAGFHNDQLYEYLRSCIPVLVELLKDPEEKTRGNAAGALGNFVRNSSSLIRDLIRYGALQGLLASIENDQEANSPRRIALFSIGNLCMYPECRKMFEDLNIRRVLKKFQPPAFTDQQVIKYAIRIKQKLTGEQSG